ncbi:MAG TPA: CehA/McbA family metallohydrolase, partial [Aggregatilineales bacterium]|nr:CehA/McbA family metallohydrolase [Aggregatilineales bacterium]
MTLYEMVGNLHVHTRYSDGTGTHAEIARAARWADLDFVIMTDHNVLVEGVEGYYGDEETGYTLVLTAEEIHNPTLESMANHMLVYADSELAQEGDDPQKLIDAVNRAKGMCFLAHPNDPPITLAHEPAYPWVSHEVTGFTGLELWNYMSSVKGVADGTGLRTALRALHVAFRPEEHILGPAPETLELWDRLLMTGQHVVAIGSSDAHALKLGYGPFRHVLYPYDFLFSCVNTHVLLPNPPTGDWRADRQAIYRALRMGSAFVGYEIPGSTRGFRFSAAGAQGTTPMGGSIKLGHGVTLQAHAP